MNKLLPCPFCGSPAEGVNRMASCTNRACRMSAHLLPSETWNTRHTPEGWVLVPSLDEYEYRALQRFDETTRDDGTYDIDGYMIRTLARKGAVRHITAGRYEMTDAGQAMLAAAPKWGGE